MTRPHHKWRGLEIAEETRRRVDDDLGHYANLRAGDMYQGDDPPRRSPGKALWCFAAGFTLAALIAAVAFGDTPPAPYTGPGWEAVCKGGC